MTKQAEYVGRAEALEKSICERACKVFSVPACSRKATTSKKARWSSRSSASPSRLWSTSARPSSPAARRPLRNADQQLQRTAELARKGNAPLAQLDQRTAEQGQAKAAVMEAEANLRDAQIQLSHTEIKTPISGRIGRAAVSPGNLVGPDSGVLATVVQDDPMQVLSP